MKIYLIRGPLDYRYAAFSHLGTWSESDMCPQCTLHDSELIEPVLVEWDPGSDEIGDFAWCGYTMIMREQVRDFFEKNGYPLQFFRTEIVKPTGKLRGQKRVPYPYDGPEMIWGETYEKVSLNMDASGVRVEIDCDVCKRKNYTFKMDGIYIDKAGWNGQKIFRIAEFGKSSAKFITEEAFEEIMEQHFTNIHITEAGVIQ